MLWGLGNVWQPDRIDRSMEADGCINEVRAGILLNESQADVRELARSGQIRSCKGQNGLLYLSLESLNTFLRNRALQNQTMEERQERDALRNPQLPESREALERIERRQNEEFKADMVARGFPLEYLEFDERAAGTIPNTVTRQAPTPEPVTERTAEGILAKFGIGRRNRS
jgi:hypothetical protein